MTLLSSGELLLCYGLLGMTVLTAIWAIGFYENRREKFFLRINTQQKSPVMTALLGTKMAAVVVATLTFITSGTIFQFKERKESAHVATDESRSIEAKFKLAMASLRIEQSNSASLKGEMARHNDRITLLSNQLTASSNIFARAQIEFLSSNQLTKVELANRDTKIVGLEAQNQLLDRHALDLSVAITNLTSEIYDSQKKLLGSEGDKSLLENELRRVVAEKADLERHFNDLSDIRAQEQKLREELALARRMDWSGHDWHKFTSPKGAQQLTMNSSPESSLPPEPQSSYEIQRNPHLDISPSSPLKTNDEVRVTVYTDVAPPNEGEHSTPLIVTVPSITAGISVSVWLSVSDQFQLRDDQVKTMVLRAAEEKSKPIVFSLRVRSQLTNTSNGFIAAYFIYEGRPCGKVLRKVTFSFDSQTNSPPSDPLLCAFRLPPGRKSAPDLTVIVSDPMSDRQNLECTVYAPALPEYRHGKKAKWPLHDSTARTVNGYMVGFTATNATKLARFASLKGSGVDLFKSSPDIFKKAFWKLRNLKIHPLKTIYVISEEPYIPWELMIPVSPQGQTDDQPLGARYSVARWLPTNHTSPAIIDIRLRSANVLAPEYSSGTPEPLPYASNEVALVLSTVPGLRVSPADFDHIDEFFSTHQADLFHFIGHGTSDDDLGRQAIFIDGVGNTIDSTQLLGMDGLARFCTRNKPFVFLNACEIGRNKPGLIGVAGFPSSFIQLGASGIVAPLWSVDDLVAEKVAQEFYQNIKLHPDRPFAEILRQIRLHAYTGDTKGEDTYAAYCFYGDPFAHLTILP